MPRGTARVIALTGAAATDGLFYSFPGVADFEVVALAVELVTGAGGGVRRVIVELLDPSGTPAFGVSAPDGQAGGSTVLYSFAPGIVAGGTEALGFMQAPIVGGRLPNNFQLQVFVAGAAAGDLLPFGRLLVNERPHERAD